MIKEKANYEIIKHPPLTDVQKFGILAYVSKKERRKIYNLPFGGFKIALQQIRRQTAWRYYRDRKKLFS